MTLYSILFSREYQQTTPIDAASLVQVLTLNKQVSKLITEIPIHIIKRSDFQDLFFQNLKKKPGHIR